MKTRIKGVLSITDYFMIFFFMQFGFHANFIYSAQWYLETATKTILVHYYSGLILTYVGLTIGFVIGRYTFLKKDIYPKPIILPVNVKKNEKIITILIISYILLFIFFGASDRLQIILQYFRFEGVHSYTEIRRILFKDTAIMNLSAFTRYTISSILFAVAVGTYIVRGKNVLLYAFLCLTLFLFCVLQLNKLVYIYYFVLTILVFTHVKIEMGKIKINNVLIFKYIKISILVILLLIGLIFMQYRALLEGNIDRYKYIFDLISYRLFISNHDALVMFYEMYPDIKPYTYFDNIGLIMKTIGAEARTPSLEVPIYFFDLNLNFTSVQSGFIASSYASFGFFGILFNSIVIPLLLLYLVRCSLNIKSSLFRGIFVALVGLNTYFLTSSQFHTALLSGGVLFIPIIFYISRIFILVLRKNSPKSTYIRKANEKYYV